MVFEHLSDALLQEISIDDQTRILNNLFRRVDEEKQKPISDRDERYTVAQQELARRLKARTQTIGALKKRSSHEGRLKCHQLRLLAEIYPELFNVVRPHQPAVMTSMHNLLPHKPELSTEEYEVVETAMSTTDFWRGAARFESTNPKTRKDGINIMLNELGEFMQSPLQINKPTDITSLVKTWGGSLAVCFEDASQHFPRESILRWITSEGSHPWI